MGGLRGLNLFVDGIHVVSIPKASIREESEEPTIAPQSLPSNASSNTSSNTISNTSSQLPPKVMPWHSVIAKYFNAPDEQPAKGYKNGGLVRGCGAAQRGKTRGKMR